MVISPFVSPSPFFASLSTNEQTHCATKWVKERHTWDLFNIAMMSHYTVRGLPIFSAQFVVAAVTGYFHSKACAAHAKGVDDCLQALIELIRVAILWHEMWHEALEEASWLSFVEHNIEGILKVLEPLHEILEEGAMRNNTTIKEKAFIQTYHHELLEAYECCMEYKRTGKDAELTRAWDLYYHVFRRIDKQLQSLTTLDLQARRNTPELVECRYLELAVPRTYYADSPVVTITSFAPQLVVITSKQRPRKLTIHGSDGKDYAFLLKGHKDLRQDEYVIQSL
ncbi:hypothetical protein Lser_V15G42925 [Lactuca serriola]